MIVPPSVYGNSQMYEIESRASAASGGFRSAHQSLLAPVRVVVVVIA
jgi:hypothetical protein